MLWPWPASVARERERNRVSLFDSSEHSFSGLSRISLAVGNVIVKKQNPVIFFPGKNNSLFGEHRAPSCLNTLCTLAVWEFYLCFFLLCLCHMTKTELCCFLEGWLPDYWFYSALRITENNRPGSRKYTMCWPVAPRELTHHNYPSLSEQGHFSCRSLWRS